LDDSLDPNERLRSRLYLFCEDSGSFQAPAETGFDIAIACRQLAERREPAHAAECKTAFGEFFRPSLLLNAGTVGRQMRTIEGLAVKQEVAKAVLGSDPRGTLDSGW